MRRYLAVLIIILWSVCLASAASYSPGDIEWGAPVTGTLSKDGTLTNGEYMVKAVEFPSPVPGIKDIKGNIVPETDVEPMVLLGIYKSGVLIKELIMNLQTGPYIDPDYEVKVSATGFPAKNARGWVYEYYTVEPPWAAISMQLRGKPKLEVTVTTDKSAYTSFSGEIITAIVTVKNTGEAKIKNVDVNLNTGELKLRGGDTSQLHQYYHTIEKGASRTFSVILVVPELIDQKSYSLSADGKGFDVKDLEYKATTSSTSLTVSPKQNYFTISKAVSKDRMYLPETVVVRVTAANGGMYDIYNIHVTDSMNENFELKSNTSFQWDIPVLKPGKDWGTTYSIQPLEASLSGFTIPAAAVQFTVNNKPYSASSKTTTVVVNGPKIILNKTVNKPVVNISEDIIVTVSIKNVGNIATRAEVKDSLPEGSSLVNGSTSLASTFLELNTPRVFNYTIRMNEEGEIKLPAAVANYTGVEYKGITRSASNSERPVVTVVDPSRIPPTVVETQTTTPTQITSQETTAAPTNTSEPTPTPITPGFDIVFAVIVLIFAAVHRRR
ncbi:MAG: DUF11 domain-containing protein [Euryarchaeota archaeon]|nr:DUF11 domain-containing protein [Euryarchaeota archaeon]